MIPQPVCHSCVSHACYICCKIYIVLIGSVEGEGGEAGGGDRHLSGGERLRGGCDQHQVQVKIQIQIQKTKTKKFNQYQVHM